MCFACKVFRGLEDEVDKQADPKPLAPLGHLLSTGGEARHGLLLQRRVVAEVPGPAQIAAGQVEDAQEREERRLKKERLCHFRISSQSSTFF